MEALNTFDTETIDEPEICLPKVFNISHSVSFYSAPPTLETLEKSLSRSISRPMKPIISKQTKKWVYCPECQFHVPFSETIEIPRCSFLCFRLSRPRKVWTCQVCNSEILNNNN